VYVFKPDNIHIYPVRGFVVILSSAIFVGKERHDVCKTYVSLKLLSYFVQSLQCVYVFKPDIIRLYTLKAGSHYERFFQRWPAFEKSNKGAQTLAKLRSREGNISFTLRTFYIRRNATFTNVSLRLTAFDSVC